MIDPVSMWLESLRAGSSRRSEGGVSIQYITDSSAERSGAIVSFRESAFRGTIGGPIDSKVYSVMSSLLNGIPAHGDGDISNIEGSVRR